MASDCVLGGYGFLAAVSVGGPGNHQIKSAGLVDEKTFLSSSLFYTQEAAHLIKEKQLFLIFFNFGAIDFWAQLAKNFKQNCPKEDPSSEKVMLLCNLHTQLMTVKKPKGKISCLSSTAYI